MNRQGYTNSRGAGGGRGGTGTGAAVKGTFGGGRGGGYQNNSRGGTSGGRGGGGSAAATTKPTNSSNPDYLHDRDKIRDFIQFFKTDQTDENEGENEKENELRRINVNGTRQQVFKYWKQVRAIARREQITLEVDIGDVLLFDPSEKAFADRIERNTLRYYHLFCEVIDNFLGDEQLQPTIAEFNDEDVLDVIQMHRAQRLASVQEEQQRLSGGARRDSAAAPNPLDPADPQASSDIASQLPKTLVRRYELRILPRSHRRYKMREIKALHIGGLVTVKAIVTRVTEVKPMIVVATYTCQKCGYEIYQEINARQFMPLLECPSAVCKTNQHPGSLTLQTRASKFMKFQEIKMQELAEEVPVGHTPRTLTVHCRGELTRRCSPGDLATISGIFLPAPFTNGGGRGGGRGRGGGSGGSLLADTYLEASRIIQHKKSYGSYALTPETIARVDEFSEQPDVYTRLARSIAPEIYGHEDVKKALLLLMTGGTTRHLPDGMRIRGDINVCLVGDPGVAKSQLLKHIATISPRGVYTSGKGSSGVGLTAAVVRDSITGEITLEGGSLVLADMGVCCIDEFDKMEEADRTAIHEVMEQQTVSIAKAGITTTLNARTAILAAANPAYGRYHPGRTPAENINLPAALLSRFDLLFVILDKPDYEADLALAHHIAHVHRFNKPPTPQFVSVEPEFIRAYIARARRWEPFVPRELTEYIVQAYVGMRADEASTEDPNSYTTARTLLGILRLSQGLARLRMSNQVLRADVDESMRLIHASKASVEEQRSKKSGGVDPMTSIYFIIRDFSVSSNTKLISYDDIERRVIAKGLTIHQLNECLSKYEELNVWQVTADKRAIKFV